MKFLVLMWAIFLMLSFTKSETTTISKTYNLIDTTNLAKPGCKSRCGDLIVPYPFGIVGINSNCSINSGFDIYCDTSSTPQRASVYEGGYTSIKLISDSTIRTSNKVTNTCYSPDGDISEYSIIQLGFMNTPYTFSDLNTFIVIGCRDYAWLTSGTKTRNVSTGCISFCTKPEEVLVNECSGNGCCQSSIPHGISYYESLQIGNISNSGNLSYIRSFNPCSYAFVGETSKFTFNGAMDLKDSSFEKRIEATVPIVLDWAIGNLSCVEAETTDGYACQSNSTCVNSTRESGGYRCVCKQGYEGNPYLSPGCQDINECNDVKTFPCYGTCVNTPGNYTCKCKGGLSGDGKTQDGCRHKPFNVLRLSLGMGLGFLTLLIGLSALYLMDKQRKVINLRQKFFEQNGGTLLEEKLKTTGRIGVASMKIFRVEELKEATNNYAEDRILGKGGNGIVYKGILTDKRVVAIKKSQKVDQEQREQFINEMEILTQINHHNVVQLLGCCLETDVPLLVYEFVSNNTLDHHIHNRKSGMGRLPWDSRLRIAHESAGALAYLHTDARMSIIHRDVKSTNILLDGNYTAKIADFGASRLVPLGHDEVMTLVQGTFGYLDPEYFHTGQLTDRSDVYSFGVVLAELLTGKQALGVERGVEDRSLATYFLKAKKENRLLEIIDRQVVMEITDEQLKVACDLICRCLNQVGGNRPSMKEVTMELETLRKFDKHPWIGRNNYKERSSLIIESEELDLYPLVSDTFGEYSSSSTGLMKEIMLQVQDPR